MTQATPVGGSYPAEAYTYDRVGNRLTKTNEQTPDINETTMYGYDDENSLTGVQITQNNQTRELTFKYDPFGRRIKKTVSPSGWGSGEETTTYGYDDENRLTGVQITQNNQTKQIIFAYDSFGRRIKKTVSPSGWGSGDETNYVYDNQNIILEYDNTNNIKTRYTHGPNIDEPLAVEIKGTTTFTPYYYHADGLGSITALTDANGNITQPYTFTAREYDTETGMYFYRARYYDQKAGRFVTKDPIGFEGGINFYVYGLNNPVSRTDPDGLYPGPCGNKNSKWVPDYPFFFDFTWPCNEHDECYGCKGKNEGKTKTQCDREFLKNMVVNCGRYFGRFNDCVLVAMGYYVAVAVSKDAEDAFREARRNCCNN